MMRKSEFLRTLATANTRFVAGSVSSTYQGLGPTSSRRVLCAAAHLRDLGILVEDENHLTLDENPMVRAVVWFGTREVTRSSALEDAEMIEEAWEYYQEHQPAVKTGAD